MAQTGELKNFITRILSRRQGGGGLLNPASTSGFRMPDSCKRGFSRPRGGADRALLPAPKDEGGTAPRGEPYERRLPRILCTNSAREESPPPVEYRLALAGDQEASALKADQLLLLSRERGWRVGE